MDFIAFYELVPLFLKTAKFSIKFYLWCRKPVIFKLDQRSFIWLNQLVLSVCVIYRSLI